MTTNLLPTLVKTWQFAVNQTVPAQTTQIETDKLLMLTIKDILKGFASAGWTCSGSSDSVTGAMDAVDRWVTTANLVKQFAGVAHSWIVLRQTGIATNFELCIDLNSSLTDRGSIIVSPAAGFTGGSNTNRPTATDEIILINTTSYTFDTYNTTFQVHAMMSDDGACTRLQVWQSGQNQCMFWLFDVPEDAETGWTDPSLSFVKQANTGYAASFANLSAAKNVKGRGSATFGMAMTGEGSNFLAATTDVIAATNGLGTNVDSFNSGWQLTKIGVASDDASHRGRHGTLYDLWWRPNGLNDGHSFPNSAPAAQQFMCFGNLVLPWLNDGTIPLFS